MPAERSGPNTRKDSGTSSRRTVLTMETRKGQFFSSNRSGRIQVAPQHGVTREARRQVVRGAGSRDDRAPQPDPVGNRAEIQVPQPFPSAG